MQISCQKWHTDKLSCTDKMAENLTIWQETDKMAGLLKKF